VLGTYRGHRPDSTAERIPSVARLHAALLCAAGFGPRAVQRDDQWSPCEADEAALRWIEDNPPTDVRIPELRVSSSPAIAYRDDGTIGKARGAKAIRKLPKSDSVVAVNGPFVWTWRKAPPPAVAEALRQLCPDVPYLGTAESPVVMSVTEEKIEPSHRLDPDAGLFPSDAGNDIDLPMSGRLEELRHAQVAERSGRVGSDRAGTDERSTSPVPPRRAVRAARYRSVAPPRAEVPWPEVLVLPLDRRIHERDRVRWAVAAHKALISVLGTAPALLTGIFPAGMSRPANRVALQVLDKDMPTRLPSGARGALAVLIPHGADPVETEAVYRAVGALRTLYVGRRDRGSEPQRARVVGGVEIVPGDRLWRDQAPGTIRLWRTDPPAVPDTRGRAGWTFTHAALLSLGFVWQGLAFPRIDARGAERDERIIDSVNAAGVTVLRTDPVRRTTVGDYAHHVHADAVIRPYRATLSLGDLGGTSTVLAIGQARHLGGGLLVPHDHLEGITYDGASG
jgi:CRISPR-associated protein Csb2